MNNTNFIDIYIFIKYLIYKYNKIKIIKNDKKLNKNN